MPLYLEDAGVFSLMRIWKWIPRFLSNRQLTGHVYGIHDPIDNVCQEFRQEISPALENYYKIHENQQRVICRRYRRYFRVFSGYW